MKIYKKFGREIFVYAYSKSYYIRLINNKK